jgi:hypothetical protein
MGQVDGYVRAVVAEWLRGSAKDIAATMKAADSPSDDAVAELDALRARQAKTEQDYDADLIDGRRYKSKMDRINAEMQSVQQRMARASSNTALSEVMASADPAQAFLDASLMSQRAIVDLLVTVRLLRGMRGVRTFNEDTVLIDRR